MSLECFCVYFYMILITCGSINNDNYSNTWVVKFKNINHKNVDFILKEHGFENLHMIGPQHKRMFHIRHDKVAPTNTKPSLLTELLKKSEKVEWIQQQTIQERFKRDFIPTDPNFKDMWYLRNTGQSSGPAGVDINVIPVWSQNITGRGVVISVLDDGVDYTHPDLMENYDPKASFDFNDQDTDPMPRDSDSENCHGTRCAGEAVATANNGICGVGVAYNAKIGGVRMLDGSATDALEASSLGFRNDYIDIYVNCWGPKDDGKTFGKPGPLAAKALKEGAEKGRKGLGSLYVWATGNGGLTDDDCNCDGYTTSIYTISVGCIGDHGLSAYYTEKCSSTIAVTFNGASHREGKENKMVTTDLYHQCTTEFKGTSASAPLAAGILALVLEANPKLSWRDVQHLIVRTAKITSPLDEGWKTNGAGLHFNHKFGYGRMDANALVNAAKTWTTVETQRECEGFFEHEKINIPISNNLVIQFKTDACSDKNNQIKKLEHVVITMSLVHRRRGDMSIDLISPSGTKSPILSTRKYDNSDEGLDEWKFMTVHFWGENPVGTWRLIVNDSYSANKSVGDKTDNEDIAEKLIDTQKEKQMKYVQQQLYMNSNFDFPYPDGVKRDRVGNEENIHNSIRSNISREARSKLLLPGMDDWSYLKKTLFNKMKFNEQTATQRVQVSSGYENPQINCLNGKKCSGIVIDWSITFYGTDK